MLCLQGSDIHHDIKDKNYTSAGLNTAFTFAPYGINRIYKSWKPAKRLSDIINKKYTRGNIYEARSKSREVYDQELKNNMSDLESKHDQDLFNYGYTKGDRDNNPRINWDVENNGMLLI